MSGFVRTCGFCGSGVLREGEHGWSCVRCDRPTHARVDPSTRKGREAVDEAKDAAGPSPLKNTGGKR